MAGDAKVVEGQYGKLSNPEASTPSPQSRIASMSVSGAYFAQDDQKHVIRLHLVWENFGDLNTTTHFAYTVLLNSSPIPTRQADPASLSFAPRQVRTLNIPVDLSPEAYASFIAGELGLEIDAHAQYDETRDTRRTLHFRAKANYQTRLLEVKRSELE